MQYKLIQRDPAERRYSLLGFDASHPVYRTAVQIDVRGHVGYAHSLTGVDFYKYVALHGADLMQQIQVRCIEADVSRSHLSLIQRAVGEQFRIHVDGDVQLLGIDLIRIRVLPK